MSDPSPAIHRAGPRPNDARSRRSVPRGRYAWLTDRLLVHTTWDTGKKVMDQLGHQVDGFVLCGAESGTAIKQLRADGYQGVLIIDAESYGTSATIAEPFALPAGDGLFDMSLEQVLQGQRDCGASFALTPTRYLHAADPAALIAAIDQVAHLDRDDVLFSVPIEAAWLSDTNVGLLAAELARLPVPKALLLGRQYDPITGKQAVTNLRWLVAEAGQVAVFRTDLTGLDVLAHGGFTTSIGTASRLRHVVPPGQFPKSNNPADQSPNLLVPPLMAFFRGSLVAERFAGTPAPACTCTVCGGRGMDTFRDRQDQIAASAHTIAVCRTWHHDLLAQPSPADRATWWRNRCREAVYAYDAINKRLHQADAFEAPKPLIAWANLSA